MNIDVHRQESEDETPAAAAAAAVSVEGEEDKKKKNRIVFAQMDDRLNNAKYFPFIQLNQAYCEKHGYEHQYHQNGFIHHHPTTGETMDIPAWWLKPFVAHHILMANDDVNAVVIADTDAVVHQKDTLVESLLNLYPSKSFLVGHDPPGKQVGG